eukprot:gene5447-9260_t
MINSIFIMNLSGYLFFQKDFLNPVDKKLSSVLVTMLTFAKKSTNRKISYIELENIAVSLTVEEDLPTPIVCAIFHDVGDGVDFGLLLSSQIIQRFISEFGPKFTITSVPKYKGFSSKIPEIFRNTTASILAKLGKKTKYFKIKKEKTRGIKFATLISNGNLPSTNTDLSVSANLKYLLSSTHDLTTIFDDESFTEIVLEDNEGSLRVIQVVKETFLILTLQF